MLANITKKPPRAMPHRYRSGVIAVALAASLLAAADTDPAARGAELLAPFKRDLLAALADGLADGPAAAIDACRVRAPEIAAALSGDDVRVGRTSNRLRNPGNTGPDWAKPLLDAYLADDSDRTPKLVRLADERYGYVEPIEAAPLCLSCHGETLAPAVATRIAEAYPDDRATGYRAGDLRGIFWVEFASAAAR